MFKKIAGFVFILLGVILALALVGQIQRFVTDIIHIFLLFSEVGEAYDTGLVIGHFLYWVGHVTVMILLLKTGVRWMRRKPSSGPPVL